MGQPMIFAQCIMTTQTKPRQNQMARDFDEEIRKLRQEVKDIDSAIWYFERLETQLAVKGKQPGKTRSPKPGTLLQMKRKAGTD